jgi:hypothetical protein
LIHLKPSEGARSSEHRLPFYQREFSSGHPAMQALNPSVYQMLIWYR